MPERTAQEHRPVSAGALFLLASLIVTASAGCGGGLVGEVPTNPGALFAWLRAEEYADWESEAERHPTEGPHGDEVLTYFNITLAASLESINVTHPPESAAVKELYRDDELAGWAVMVKPELDSRDGDGWYFYETFDPVSGSNAIAGMGESACVGCHSEGRDFIQTDWPQ